MKKKNKSIIPNNDENCFLCKQIGILVKGTDEHHMLFGNKRKFADEDGLTVQLCHNHHMRLHQQNEHQLELKQLAEKTWLEYYGKTVADFIERYGMNYLDDI